MTPEQFKQFNKNIQESITNSIESTVNGKIRVLTTKIDDYIKSDDEWKAEVKPYIENMKLFEGFTSTGTAILKGVLLLGGAVGVIYGLFIWIAGLK